MKLRSVVKWSAASALALALAFPVEGASAAPKDAPTPAAVMADEAHPNIHFYAHYNVAQAKLHAEAGELGLARLHLERARWLKPFDLQLQRGLSAVNWQVQRLRMERFNNARLTQGEPSNVWTWRLFNVVPTRIWAYLMLGSTWMACLMVVLFRQMRRSLRRDAVALSAGLSMLLGIVGVTGWIGCLLTGSALQPAVVVTPNALAWSAPDAMVQPTSNPDLYEGAVVLIRSEDGEWIELELSDGERVWTKRSAAREISAHRDDALRGKP